MNYLVRTVILLNNICFNGAESNQRYIAIKAIAVADNNVYNEIVVHSRRVSVKVCKLLISQP